MGKFEDLTGQIFTRYTVLEPDLEMIKRTKSGYWICRCECGTVKSVSASLLKSGRAKSCGCLNKENASKKAKMMSELNKKTNEIYINDQMGIGVGYFNNKPGRFTFDAEDLDIVKQHCWYLSNNGYVITTIRLDNGKRKTVFLHRLILEKHYGKYEADQFSDHADHDKTNNCKYNLRKCTRSENNRNVPDRESNTGERNIFWDYRCNKYRVKVTIDNISYVEYFENIKDAIEYRNNLYIKHDISNFVYDADNDFRNVENNNNENSIINPFNNICNKQIITPFYFID